jgi:hypothetical protein
MDDFSQELKEYNLKELSQLQKMTEEVRDHWMKMITQPMNEGMKEALRLSIQQTEDDLKLILAETEKQKMK